MLKDEYKVYEEKMKKSIESVMSDFDTVRAEAAPTLPCSTASVWTITVPHAHPADRLYRLARPADAGHYPLGCQHSEGY